MRTMAQIYYDIDKEEEEKRDKVEKSKKRPKPSEVKPPQFPYNDIAYKIEPGQEMIHSKYVRDGVYDVAGTIIRANNHYEAIKKFEEMQK